MSAVWHYGRCRIYFRKHCWVLKPWPSAKSLPFPQQTRNRECAWLPQCLNHVRACVIGARESTFSSCHDIPAPSTRCGEGSERADLSGPSPGACSCTTCVNLGWMCPFASTQGFSPLPEYQAETLPSHVRHRIINPSTCATWVCFFLLPESTSVFRNVNGDDGILFSHKKFTSTFMGLFSGSRSFY